MSRHISHVKNYLTSWQNPCHDNDDICSAYSLDKCDSQGILVFIVQTIAFV